MRREWKHWNSTIQLCVCVCLDVWRRKASDFLFWCLWLLTTWATRWWQMRSQRNSNIKHRYHQKKALPRVPAFPVKYNFAPFFLILGSLKLLCKTLICEMFQSSDSNSLKRTSAPERKTPNSGSSGGSVETSATQKCDGEWSQDPHVY